VIGAIDKTATPIKRKQRIQQPQPAGPNNSYLTSRSIGLADEEGPYPAENRRLIPSVKLTANLADLEKGSKHRGFRSI